MASHGWRAFMASAISATTTRSPIRRCYASSDRAFRVRPGLEPENRMDILGVEFKDEDFVRGIRMWAMDQLDVTVRIDITIGWLREFAARQRHVCGHQRDQQWRRRPGRCCWSR